MIIKVIGEHVNMPVDQYAEVLDTVVRGVTIAIKVRLLGTDVEMWVRPWAIIGVQLSDDLTLKCEYKGYEYSETAIGPPRKSNTVTKLYAVYSAKQAELGGTFIYQRPDGTEVEVTAVDKIPGCPETKWSDKQDLGEITQFIRRGICNER